MPFLSAVKLVERECSVGVGPCNTSAGELCDSPVERTSIKFINTDVYRASILTSALRVISLCWLTFCYCLTRSWCGTLKYVWKVKLSLCLAGYRAMRTYGGGGIAPHIFTLMLCGVSGWLHAPERTPRYPWYGSLDAMRKSKNSFPATAGNRTPDEQPEA
jgi:hypothetical protein